MSTKVRLVFLILSAVLCFHQINIKAAEEKEYKITDIRIFKDTPAWQLARAVKGQQTGAIERIVKTQPDLVNYQEPKYGATLLLWAVGTEKYRSAEALLKYGADPNIASTSEGETPLFVAAGYSWVDYLAKKDPQYVKLLLRYGADPNINYKGSDIPGEKSVIEPGTSPLMNSITAGIEKTKALVEAGADINYQIPKTKNTAAGIALLSKEFPEYAHYLIVEKKAKVTEPTYRRTSYFNEDPKEKFFPVNILRKWVFDLDSEKYKIKMEIVEEFVRQGVNYWETPIHKDTLNQIKKIYPDNWEEYIKKY